MRNHNALSLNVSRIVDATSDYAHVRADCSPPGRAETLEWKASTTHRRAVLSKIKPGIIAQLAGSSQKIGIQRVEVARPALSPSNSS